MGHMPTIGHARILSFFANARACDMLSHAYCFSGPTHVGKRTVAEHLAGELLCTSVSALATHPDFLLIERDGKDITIEQAGQVRSALAKAAFLGGYQVVIIQDAERLNASSANALLKTLEEPKKRAVIILITQDETQLPETILSRCQLILFSPVAEHEVARALETRGIPAQRAAAIARYAHGLPGLAVDWAADTDAYDAHQNKREEFYSLWQKPLYKKLELLEGVFGGDKGDHLKTRDAIYAMLDVWEVALRDFVRGEKKERADKVLRIEEKIRQAKLFLPKNVHPRLLIEQILLEIP